MWFWYLPAAEKTFMRFWWQWSSGKFSATTMRDYRSECTLYDKRKQVSSFHETSTIINLSKDLKWVLLQKYNHKNKIYLLYLKWNYLKDPFTNFLA